VKEPSSEAELFRRARELAGRTLGDVAEGLDVVVPPDLKRHKGWVGSLVERQLGASAGSKAVPDFPELAVELKTLPVDARGKPRESTFVCTIELNQIADIEWAESRVAIKLNRVLWVPVQADPSVPLGERRVGEPLLWSPSEDDEALLRFDWEELAGLIACGQTESVTAHLGRYLQVRPKAANSHVKRRVVDASGLLYSANPRGFYLRTQFTERLLARHYARPA
jgi:DNA mismatch repair protein MutH